MQLIYLHNLLDVAVNRACAIIVHHTDICTLAQKQNKNANFFYRKSVMEETEIGRQFLSRKNLLARSFLMERAFSKSQRSAL